LIVHRATAGFWRRYDALPKSVQKLADKSFELLKENPRHPSLHFKRVKKVWSVRVSKNHRALALPSDDGYDWFWIGDHGEYERLIG